MEDATIQQAFKSIYEQNSWSHGSGPGSRSVNTVEYRAFLERFIEANGIASVTDLGCGDWQSSKQIDWSAVRYTGFDVVESVVMNNRVRHGRSNITFHSFRSIDDLPGGDLLIAKEVLQHLPNRTILDYLPVIRAKYRYALVTNSTERSDRVNSDILPGGYRPLDLGLPPFSIPGACVLTYFPRQDGLFFHNVVYLVMGREG